MDSSAYNKTAISNDDDDQDPPVEHHDIKTSIAAVAGNILEWYDFSVFGAFSDIIGKVFFPPNQDGNAALIESFAVFGIAFLARPIGGAIIGQLGDDPSKGGRKGAVETSILLMALPTVALGCLPSFEAVGWVAPVLLTIMRFLQGFSVGGQLMSSLVFTLERADKRNWGIWSASVFAVSTIGTVLGSLLSYILRESLSDEELESWGWRIPFLLGVMGIIPGAYLKYASQEQASHMETNLSKELGPGQTKRITFLETFRSKNRRALLASMLVPCVQATAYYVIFVWMGVYMESIVEIPHAFAINTVVGLLGIFLLMLGGWISDTCKNHILIMVITSITIAISGPIFLHMIAGGDPMVAFACQLFFAFVLSVWCGAMLPWMVNSFPPEIRLTSVSMGYNFAISVCGGFAPVVATILVDRYSPESPGYMLTGVAFLSWIGLCIAPKNTGSDDYGTAPELEAMKDIEIT